MDLNEARSILSKVTYKPGWRFRLDERSALNARTDELVTLEASAGDVPDVECPSRKSAIYRGYTWSRQVFDGLQPDAFLLTLYGLVDRMERHEVNEWLRFEGRPLVESHPELLRGRAVLGLDPWSTSTPS